MFQKEIAFPSMGKFISKYYNTISIILNCGYKDPKFILEILMMIDIVSVSSNYEHLK